MEELDLVVLTHDIPEHGLHAAILGRLCIATRMARRGK
jgi:hypothetical protein